MAIERWEMLLSSRADCYLLKIRSPRSDVDKIVAAHPTVCQEVHEIQDDVFQWTVFVVDAPLAVRLAIQNLVMSMTAESGPARASAELGEMMEGLSGALDNLANLTDDERQFVMQKMTKTPKDAGPTPPLASLQNPVVESEPPSPADTPKQRQSPPSAPGAPVIPPAPSPLNPAAPAAPRSPVIPPAPPPLKPAAPATPAKGSGPLTPGPRLPGAPTSLPPIKPPSPGTTTPPITDRPLPRVNPMPMPQVGKMGMPPAPGKPAANPVPPIVRPVQPPASPGAAGKPPLPPVSPLIRPVQASPAPPLPKQPPPRVEVPESQPSAPPPPPKPPPAPPVEKKAQTPPPAYTEMPGTGRVIDLDMPGAPEPASEEKMARPSSPPNEPSPKRPIKDGPTAQGIEPLAYIPPPAAVKPSMTPFGPSFPTDPSVFPLEMERPLPASGGPGAPLSLSSQLSSPPDAGSAKGGEELPLRFTIFFPVGGESLRDRFTAMLTDVAQKKARKPLQFQIVGSVPTTVTMEHSTEWIWTAKANNADCFFVLLPPDVLPDYLEGITAEAQSAGMRCFLVPQNEVGSKLLYMDFMLELMMIKRKVKWG